MKQGETFEDGAEFDCPECGDKYSYVMWPRTVDMATDPRAPEIEAYFGIDGQLGQRPVQNDSQASRA